MVTTRSSRPGGGALRSRAASRRAKPKDSEARWEEILNAAANVFLKKGYEAATLQEIATEVGILKGSIYYYIKTKEDLLFEIVSRAQTNYEGTMVEDPSTASAGAPERLSAFIVRWMSQGSKDHSWGRVGEREFTRLSRDRLRVVIARRDQFSDFVKGIIQQGMKEGAFDASTDVSLATIAIFELLRGTRDWHQPRGRLTSKGVADWYSQFVIRGLGGPDWAASKDGRRR